VVPGSGTHKTQIVFIGEGPGKNEDEQGIPFCGAAGKFLEELLDSIGLKREQIYITNMVKCRPPNNRDPQEDEIMACRPWLDQQLDIIKPKVLVLLGRFAMGRYFPTLKISQAHGKAYKRGGILHFIMFHPAVALYNGSYRAILKEDFLKLGSILRGDLGEVEDMDGDLDDIKEKLEEKRKEKKKKEQMGMGL
jgi:DNA polymerase